MAYGRHDELQNALAYAKLMQAETVYRESRFSQKNSSDKLGYQFAIRRESQVTVQTDSKTVDENCNCDGS